MRLGCWCDNQQINKAGVSDSMKKYSILDLCPVCEGNSVGEAFENCVDLAKNVEQFGYTRIWLAEHHNMAGIASLNFRNQLMISTLLTYKRIFYSKFFIQLG